MGDEFLLERILNGDEDPKDLPLPLLQSITDDFSEDRKIGHGGFGEVYKGVLHNGIIVAVKRMYVNQHTVDDVSFRREISSLMKINHQNVVRFLGFCSHAYHTSIKEAGSTDVNFVNVRERLLCLEYISNGSLDKHITDELRGLEWETRYEIIIGICEGLRYLHEDKNIVHMDLKPENILLDGTYMVPKITDFGLSRSNKNSHTMGLRFGTRGYLAPEYEHAGKTSFKSDVYSLGAIIFELLSGSRGVPDVNNVLRRWRHRWNNPPTPLQYQQVTRCVEIAVHCRQQEPGCRPSISEIISFLSEPERASEHTDRV
uniref:non-specific serine/threonine protein kinase n=1 Tax=Triticum urartu TaxID=4572 RepID=A0A8R7UWX4_TRIUA